MSSDGWGAAAQKIKAWLEREGINQSTLASRMGISEATLSRYLSGNASQPKPGDLRKLAHFMGMTTSELLGEGMPPKPSLPPEFIGELRTVAGAASALAKSAERLVEMAAEWPRGPDEKDKSGARQRKVRRAGS